MKNIHKINENIYITSDEEIKEDDYYLSWEDCYNPPKYVIYVKSSGVNGDGKKIILTTDQDLIEEGVQAIDDNFLEWFVNNSSCESVEVKKGFADGSKYGYNFLDYKIIIPKEEAKQECNCDNTCDRCAEKEKQQILQEAKEKAKSTLFRYSEQEVLDILYKHTEDLLSGKKITLEEWFDKIKKN